jgi:hypothetical protein
MKLLGLLEGIKDELEAGLEGLAVLKRGLFEFLLLGLGFGFHTDLNLFYKGLSKVNLLTLKMPRTRLLTRCLATTQRLLPPRRQNHPLKPIPINQLML